MDEDEGGAIPLRLGERDRQQRIEARTFASSRSDEPPEEDDARIGHELDDLALEAADVAVVRGLPDAEATPDSLVDLGAGHVDVAGREPRDQRRWIEPCPVDAVDRRGDASLEPDDWLDRSRCRHGCLPPVGAESARSTTSRASSRSAQCAS